MEPVKAVSVNRFVFKCVSATHTYSHTNFLSTFCCALNLAYASKVEFLVDDKDHLIIWKHKGDECKLYKKIPITDQQINCKKMMRTVLYMIHLLRAVQMYLLTQLGR
jgi:hypothetical protein